MFRRVGRSSIVTPTLSTMPGGNDYGEPKTAQHRVGKQAIANESWPLRDKTGGHARGIEDQPKPIAVEVRIEWATDGEEWLAGTATRWTASHVFVRFEGQRSLTGFVWVRAVQHITHANTGLLVLIGLSDPSPRAFVQGPQYNPQPV